MILYYLLGVHVRSEDVGKDGQSNLGTGRHDHNAAREETKTFM
jgi:hypothetical protein